MDTQDNNTPKRHRRKKADLEQDLFNAANKIIKKHGFTGLTMSRLMREAKAENAVFYNRYKDMNDFLDKFVRNYDYWLNDSLQFNSEAHPLENAKNLMVGLIDSLLESNTMQKLIAWEMNEKNFITQRAAQNRDNNSQLIIEYFEKALANCKVSFNVGTAVMLGGIYYLIIHRELGTFNNIDFSTPEGIAKLKHDIPLMLEQLYQDYQSEGEEDNSKEIEIARRLIKNNVERKIIKESTGLADEILDTLY